MPSAAANGSSSVRVLLVEDSDDEREMYASYLQNSGYVTLQCRTADEALRMASELVPDVIVTDVAMPGEQDGFWLVTRLKGQAETRRIPVIVVTGHTFAVHRELAVRAGCQKFLPKPCPPDCLEREVRRAVMQSVA